MNDDLKPGKLARIKELIEKGNEYLEKQDYKLALSTFDIVLSEEPRFFGALIGKMKIYTELFQWQNVIVCCDKILEVNPKEETALEHKVWALFALKEYSSALKLARTAQKDYPDNTKIQKCIEECIKKVGTAEPKVEKKKVEMKHIRTEEPLMVPEARAVAIEVPELSEMKKHNRFLIIAVYSFLMGTIITFLFIDLIYFKNTDFNTGLIIEISLYACLLGSFLILIAFNKETNLTELGISSQNAIGSAMIGIFVSSGFLITALLFWIAPIITDITSILGIALLTMLIGIVEELFFRGYIQSKARKTSKRFVAIIVTGVLFAVLHVPKYLIMPVSGESISSYASIPAALQQLVILGFLFGFIRENTKNITGPIVAHATWDFYLLIYVPTSYVQLLNIPNQSLYLAFQEVAGYAMLGTFLLAWAISKALKVNRLEDPRELGFNIMEMLGAAKKYDKKARKFQYKVNALVTKQRIHQSRYYTYRGLEIKIRIYQSRIDFYDKLNALFQKVGEELTVDNFTEMMDYRDEQERLVKREYIENVREGKRAAIHIKKTEISRPTRSKYNSLGFDISRINMTMRDLEQKKYKLQMNREHYSMIRDMYSEKNPNRARRYGSRVQDLENKIEYYETLMDIYKEVAETVTNENYQMKREYIQEQTAIAKRRLTDKMRYGKKY